MKNKLRKIYYFFITISRLNIFKTVYFNFKVLKFSDAIKFPFWLYGKIEFSCLRGKFIIESNNISSGMIKIGYRYLDLVPLSYLTTQVSNSGKIIFKGKAIIGGGVSLISEGQIEIGRNCTIGGGSMVKSIKNISIGENTRITFGCTIFDSNIHFVKNIETGIIMNNSASIVIGKNCWLNYGTYIAKGASVPDYTVSAKDSFLNKDYSEYGENLFLVGAPAKPLNIRVQRIFSVRKETQLNHYFKNNSEMDFIKEEIGLYDDVNDLFN